MEIEENHCGNKRSRMRENHQDEDDGKAKRSEINNNDNVNNNRMRPWHHPSSRIYRVSKASGGKDRHSKVYTSKGLRDRRVRLSVSTAIQFYDLQDRLGYDQPSKAIEWLIKAAASAIAELPSLDTNFPEPLNQQMIIEKPMLSDSGIDPEAEPSYNQQQHSSTSETSKGSVLSLSRSEIRVKARERAREKVKDKEKDKEDVHVDVSLNSQGSFTKLLTGATTAVTAGQASSSSNFIQKQMQNLPPVSSTADYFSTQSGFSSQAHFGNSNSPIGMVPLISSAGDHQVEMQQFPFLQDHFFPAPSTEGSYNLNFSISPGLAGFHRGTLQSNSPSHQNHHHQLSHRIHQHNQHQLQAQRLSLALDGSSVPMPVPFFFGSAAGPSSATENEYSSGFDRHLQLDGYKHLELKGKGKG